MVVAQVMKDKDLESYWARAGGDRRRFLDTAFADVAGDYDRLVRSFSGGLDRRWRRKCVEACEIERGGWVLDCATGTGALALAAASLTGTVERVVAMDACAAMLTRARSKAVAGSARLAWVQADAEHLPVGSERVAAITMGFALRHMDITRTLGEMRRVLVPGGRLALLEFLRPSGGVAPWLALAYLRWIVPPLAGLFARSRTAGTLAAYLPRTIEIAPSLRDLAETVKSAGLQVIRVESLFARVVWVLVAVKPPGDTTCEVRG
jgi:demethylmenaquinone methyltransferase / 2-methoxy-6-polyprenyl-1,4-benzoquinol methylase